MKKAVKTIIKGTVQGIFFRDFIKGNADKLRLGGYVRNLDNGAVEVFLEGDIESVDKMCEICKEGPKHAKIKSVEISESTFQDFKDFKILHL
ncbi:MAG: acylphosphatase [Candidatus Pacearchaeota archaeon]